MRRKNINALISWKNENKRKPLILRGARQVGKTYLLQEFGKTSFPRSHYLNFESDEALCKLFEKDLNPSRILEELQFFLDTSIDTKKDIVIFDEIQLCPRALTSLKYFCEQMPKLALCAAGSLLGVSLTKEAFPVGKVTFMEMFPMNFEEFLDGIGKQNLANTLRAFDLSEPLPEMAHDRLWDLWKRYLIVGGLPEVVNTYRENIDNQFEALKKVRRLQRDLLDTYLADIAKHSGKTNAMHIERLWRNVPGQLARTQNGSASKFRFKDALPGVRGYERLSAPLGWLENARLVLRTSIVERPETPLAGYSKENRFKQYFFDVGLLTAVSGIDPALILKYDYGSYKGYIAENFVAQELHSVGIRDLYCWEGRTSEVEFLIETESGIVPCEVKSGWVTHSKSLKVYEERFHPKKSFVLSAKNVKKQNARYFVPLYTTGPLGKKLIEDFGILLASSMSLM